MSTHIVPGEGRNGYIAHWRGHKFEIHTADGIYQAKLRVQEYILKTFRPRGNKWTYDINIGIAEQDGEAVVHVADT